MASVAWTDYDLDETRIEARLRKSRLPVPPGTYWLRRHAGVTLESRSTYASMSASSAAGTAHGSGAMFA